MPPPNDGDITVTSIAREERPREAVSLRVLFEAERGPVSVPPVPLSGAPLPVGRQIVERGIQLRDPRASRRHAIFHPTKGPGVMLEDVSSNGTFVNGERVSGSRVLEDGDLVRIGDSFLVVRWAPAEIGDAEVPEIEGRHPAMRALRRTIASVAPTDAKVLVVGESGTGKELVARAIHERSGRPGPFIAVNCGAIPESLAESQLFGHVAGAFTGAQGAHTGFVRAADRGTLFLDEIGELSLVLQPKLLRALEERKVVPVGEDRAHRRRRAPRRGHQPRPPARGGRRPLPGRPLRARGRLRDPHAAPARAARGRAPAADALPRAGRGAPLARSRRGPLAALLPLQRARAEGDRHAAAHRRGGAVGAPALHRGAPARAGRLGAAGQRHAPLPRAAPAAAAEAQGSAAQQGGGGRAHARVRREHLAGGPRARPLAPAGVPLPRAVGPLHRGLRQGRVGPR
ncbi:MAG: sigma-54-dependent Fis family transcriptional regulator [Sandaracinaceae bacterium]|nr:sigma-54-dependent Fis family transcriptional regulator [Sandaracinaceae bacterium]